MRSFLKLSIPLLSLFGYAHSQTITTNYNTSTQGFAVSGNGDIAFALGSTSTVALFRYNAASNCVQDLGTVSNFAGVVEITSKAVYYLQNNDPDNYLGGLNATLFKYDDINGRANTGVKTDTISADESTNRAYTVTNRLKSFQDPTPPIINRFNQFYVDANHNQPAIQYTLATRAGGPLYILKIRNVGDTLYWLENSLPAGDDVPVKRGYQSNGKLVNVTDLFDQVSSEAIYDFDVVDNESKLVIARNDIEEYDIAKKQFTTVYSNNVGAIQQLNVAGDNVYFLEETAYPAGPKLMKFNRVTKVVSVAVNAPRCSSSSTPAPTPSPTPAPTPSPTQGPQTVNTNSGVSDKGFSVLENGDIAFALGPNAFGSTAEVYRYYASSNCVKDIGSVSGFGGVADITSKAVYFTQNPNPSNFFAVFNSTLYKYDDTNGRANTGVKTITISADESTNRAYTVTNRLTSFQDPTPPIINRFNQFYVDANHNQPAIQYTLPPRSEYSSRFISKLVNAGDTLFWTENSLPAGDDIPIWTATQSNGKLNATLLYGASSEAISDFTVADNGATLFIAVGAINQYDVATGKYSQFYYNPNAAIVGVGATSQNVYFIEKSGSPNSVTKLLKINRNTKVVSVAVNAPLCSGSSTPAPTPSPTKTPTPTPVPTSIPTRPASQCFISFDSKVQSTWSSNGVTYTQFQVVLKNIGSYTYGELYFNPGSSASRVIGTYSLQETSYKNYYPYDYAFPLTPNKNYTFGITVTGSVYPVYTIVRC